MKIHDLQVRKDGEKMYAYILTGAEKKELSRKLLTENENSAAHFHFVLIETDSWNDRLSPWEAPPVFGREGFGGGGKGTLRWLMEEVIPAVEGENFGDNRRIIGGYSLAGLFSLWAFYETGLFEGAVSCSSSLWYPGWDRYMQGRSSPVGGKVYLSLGDSEERTKNQQMQKVGERTRRQLEMLKEDENISEAKLEWNPGGHFKDAEERLTKGIRWMMKAMQKRPCPE